MQTQKKNKSDNHLDKNTDDINMDKDRENNSGMVKVWQIMIMG